MNSPVWLPAWMRRALALPVKRRGRNRPHHRLAYPLLEPLEVRIVPATVTWIGGSGDWNTVANWLDDAMNNRLPGPDDDAVIDVAGISVTHSSGTHTIKSLTSNNPFDLSGGTLMVTGSLQEQNANAFTLSGGTLSGAIVAAATTITATSAHGTLDGVTIAGELDVIASQATAAITGGMTLDSGLVKVGWGNSISFSGTLGGTGTVQFTDDNNQYFSSPGYVSAAGAMTFGPDVTVTGTQGIIDDNNASFINQGTIRFDTGGSIRIGGIGDAWTNQGTIEALNGATVNLIGSWTNSGTFSEISSTLNLGGAFKTSTLGAVNRSGGSVNITGTLTNDGILTLDDTSGSWNLTGGKIVGGRISTAGSAVLAATAAHGTLDGVTIAGELDVIASQATAAITGGMTLDSGLVKVGWGNSISFSGTLGGTGTVQFTDDNNQYFSSPGYVSAAGAMTFGPDVTVTGTQGIIDDNNASFINQGTIRFDTGGSIRIGGIGDAWTNQGTIEALNGATVNLIGSWTNSGTFSEISSTLNLGGAFKTSTLGAVNRSGGSVNITGTLTNDGILTLDDTSGSWNLTGGKIVGGRISTAGSAVLAATAAHGTLDGVTIAGELDVIASQATAAITGGMTLDSGLVKVGWGNSISFSGTLGGTGTVQFTDDNNQYFSSPGYVSAAGAMTFGPDVTVTGTQGIIDDNNASFINQGTIRFDTGGSIRIGGIGDAWTNQGTIEALNGATVNLIGSWTNSGTFSEISSTLNLGGAFKTSTLGAVNRSGGSVNITGTLTNDGILTLDDTSGSWNLTGGKIVGGTVFTSGTNQLVVTNPGHGLLDGVTLHGVMNLAAFSTSVINGLTLDQGRVELFGSESLNFDNSQTLGGSGEVVFLDAGINALNVAGGSLLTIAAGVTIHGNTGFIVANANDILLQGTIRADGGGTLTVSGVSNFAAGTLTGGSWQVVGNSVLQLEGADITTNAASILVDGSNAKLLDGGATSAIAGLIANAVGGHLTIQNGANVSIAGVFTNQGSLTVGAGSTFTAASLDVASGGVLNGSGTVAANVINGGLVGPGTSPGILTVNGDYSQSATGILTIEIGGTTAGSGYDQLNVSGATTIDGTLNVDLINGFGPTTGQMFQVMNLHGETGAFATINSPVVGSTPLFDIQLSNSGLLLTAQVSASDLAFDQLTLPPAAVSPGQAITIPFTVQNLSSSVATGGWYDSFYLSTDGILDANDVLLGRVFHSDDVAGDSGYQGTLDAIMPNVPDSNYRVLVLIDSRSTVPDMNRANNFFASAGAMSVQVPALTLGTPITTSIASGQDKYFRLNLSAGQDVMLAADFAVSSEAEFYVRYGTPPDRGNFDQTASPSDLHSQILLNNTQGGSYYILLHGRESAGSGTTFTLRADAIPFAITSVSPNHGSDAGAATLTLAGTQFTTLTSVSLVAADDHILPAASVSFRDEHTLFATFNLNGVAPGTYAVQVMDHNSTSTLAGSFAVTNGKPGQLQAYLNVPSVIRPHQPDTRITIDYANVGDTDIPAPVFTIQAENAFLYLPGQIESDENTFQVLGINWDGPAGILPPGYHGTVQVQFTPETFGAHVKSRFTLFLPAGADTVMNWDALEESHRPGYVAADAWDAVWTNFTAAAGPTAGTYQTLLAQDATALSRMGIYTADVKRLFSFELQKADDVAPTPTLHSALDAFFPAPGPGLSFARAFQQPLDGRLRLGRLGRGWVDNYDVSIAPNNHGRVLLQQAGAARYFALQPDGSFIDESGAFGTLTVDQGKFQLREINGTVLAFRTDGQLDYFQDTEGNRITAGYTNGLLTSITHSDGDALTLAYNAQGRISQVIDPAGRVTAYQYDATGEQLISVTVLAGTADARTTQYAYSASTGGPTGYELLTVTSPDGSQVFFQYDGQGRLIGTHRSGGANAITYTYAADGGVIVTDALGNSGTYFTDDNGRVRELRDGLGRVTQFDRDDSGSATLVSIAGGGALALTNDARGNPLRAVDPLGQQAELTYDLTFNELSSLLDANGNTTRYQYDSRGNLTAIVQPDGHGSQYSYDALGSVTASTNERGQTIQYTYNPRGELLRKDYPDGSHVDFTYDNRANLSTAAQVNGATTLTTTFTYDTADRLIQVTDPDGRFLQYAYDALGRRTQMTDQDGFTVHYGYDDVGRLVSLTSGPGNGTTVVIYTYDAAGQVVREDHGNGTYTTYEYDAAGQLLHLINFGPPPGPGQDGPVLSRFDYTYDALGARSP